MPRWSASNIRQFCIVKTWSEWKSTRAPGTIAIERRFGPCSRFRLHHSLIDTHARHGILIHSRTPSAGSVILEFRKKKKSSSHQLTPSDRQDVSLYACFRLPYGLDVAQLFSASVSFHGICKVRHASTNAKIHSLRGDEAETWFSRLFVALAIRCNAETSRA